MAFYPCGHKIHTTSLCLLLFFSFYPFIFYASSHGKFAKKIVKKSGKISKRAFSRKSNLNWEGGGYNLEGTSTLIIRKRTSF